MALRLPIGGRAVDRRSPVVGFRRALFGAVGKYVPIVAVEVEGLTFLVSTADMGVGRRLFAHGAGSDTRVLARAVAELDRAGLGVAARSGAFLDVGANIGTACLAAVGVHSFNSAVALEPEDRNYALLRANADLNSLDRQVSTYQLAASNEPGEVTLSLDPKQSGHHRIRRPKKNRQSIQIEAVTLDGLLARLALPARGVGLLWIDAEGHEREVLEGAASLVEERVPIVVEVEGRRASLPLLPLVETYSRVVDLRTEDPARPVRVVDRLVRRLRADSRSVTDLLFLP